MKKILLLLLLFAGMANAQIVTIPDANFKARLLEADVTNNIAFNGVGDPMKVDANNDGEIQETEALAVYNLRLWNSTIFNLTGISSFTNLTSLDCSNNILFNLDVSALSNLVILNCPGNFITTLDVSGLTHLTQLFCDNNRLTSVNINGTTNLLILSCNNNLLTTLDLSNTPNLALLLCDSNHISNLDVTGLTNLGTLSCNNNNLTSLNLNGMTNLQQLLCSHNQLTSLDVTALTNVHTLHCFYNQISSLDLSNSTNLTNLSCGENSITELNLNGLTHLTYLECSYLPDNLVIHGANLNALTDFQYTGQNYTLTLNGFPNVNNVHLTIPQPFVILNVTGFNDNSNIYLSLSNSLTTNLTINGSGITHIKSINCVNNRLTTLNLNGLNNLETLNCSNNKLTSLNLSGLTNLTYLAFGSNKLTNIDLSGVPNLKHLDCNNNKLTSLDVSGSTALEYLDCSNNAAVSTLGNEITLLAVSGLTQLKYLDCSNYNFNGLIGASANQITSLDVNGLIHMEQLKCSKNNISTLVVNGLTNLTDLDCSYNLLTSLDLIGLTNLIHLNYRHNQLSNLNMTGLVNITELDCSENNISTLNVVDMPNLTKLACGQNLLSTLNLSGLNLITSLYCDNNMLTSLDVSAMPNLTNLSCNSNQLTTLEVNNLVNLTWLQCSSNLLTSLNVTALTNLIDFSCSSNQLTSIDVSTLVNLLDFKCDHNQLTTLDVNTLPMLRSLYCNVNQLTTLDISALTYLQTLLCGNNSLTSLIPNPTASFLTLECAFNQITSLDLKGLSNLANLICNDNQLTELFIKNGSNEQFVGFSNNPDLTYICADDFDVEAIQTQLNNLNMTSTVSNSYCSFTPGGPHNTIVGTTIFDGNNNGCNSNDPLHPNIRVDISDGTTTGSAFTNTNGNCTFYTDAGNYTIFPNIENAAAFNISPAEANINFPDNDNNISSQSFCLSPNGIHPDVEIVITPIGPARPGFDAEYKIVYKNKGNQTLSGNIELFFEDAKLDLVSAFPVTDSQTENNLNWAYGNLLPFESRSIDLVFNVNSPVETPAVNNGDILNFTTSVTPVVADELPIDNQFILGQIVVGSFDPNQKDCLEGETVSPEQIGKYLHYNIQFENLGTAEAVNIVVKDVIDTNVFDINTLQVMYASHEMRASIRENVVEFIFTNINLAPAAGDPPVGGHGNVLFKIKTLNTLTTGDEVINKANIFFDYNAPIVTNEAITLFSTLSTPDVPLDESVTLYPNPVRDILNIQCNNSIKTIALYDVGGRLLETVITHEDMSQLDLSNKASGVYFVKITTENGHQVKQVIKE